MRLKPFSVVVCVFASFLVIGAFIAAEQSLRTATAIPDFLFYGIPIAAAATAMISLHRTRRAQDADPARRREINLYLGIALVVAIVPMVLLSDRYNGRFDAPSERVAPDGSPVTSITWSEEGGHYIERVNRKFETELTEEQYREIMRKHQQTLIAAILTFASVAFWISLATVILESRRPENSR